MAKTVSYRGYADAVKRFDVEPSPGRQRNRFNYAKRRLMTFDAGHVIPFFWQPVLPGDDLSYQVRALIRLSNPLVSPLMDEIWVKMYFFKSYNQFVFADWKPFMGELIQDNPDYDDSGQNKGGQSLTTPPYVAPDEYQLPTMTLKKGSNGRYPFEIHSLLDYLALPYAVGNDGYTIQTLLPRHCNLIYNEYFRDENLQDFAPVPKTMGPDQPSQFQLMPSLKYQDYITGSLPFLQKGPNVLLGLTGDVPVVGTGDTLGFTDGKGHSYGLRGGTTYLVGATNNAGVALPSTNTSFAVDNTVNLGLHTDPSLSGARAVLSQSQALALAQVRLAFQLMRFYEGQARSGTRYIEYVHFMFNEYVPDVELTRPEYIGGGKFFINVNPVAQTSSTTNEQSSLASLAAFGVSFDASSVRAHTHSREHGYVIGFLVVGTSQTYQQGLQRDFWYRDRFDFYTPTLAHLAEQAVNNGEVCMTGIKEYDNGTWGYIGRYDEYRTMLGEVCGYFRSNAQVWDSDSSSYKNVSLDSYHLAQFFDVSNPGTSSDNYAGLPHLNANFIQQPKETIDRAMNITSKTLGVPQFLADITTTCRGVRVVSKYGIPGFADHF
ncbi:major capsid protein [Sigmofec virus UA08Rod_6110]|uniref:Major capsid protein n=1 Tax=Sigmofec virus UA08Rod_6110 TaxID=2929452 RepID=A0A976N1G1_9VIRU|nr:major capsid protein [Sigmofec virus UA08Rod_6110]